VENSLGSSNVIAGVASFEDNTNCAGTGGAFRLDRKDVVDFVSPYLKRSAHRAIVGIVLSGALVADRLGWLVNVDGLAGRVLFSVMLREVIL
jgi:hypothetical protein